MQALLNYLKQSKATFLLVYLLLLGGGTILFTNAQLPGQTMATATAYVQERLAAAQRLTPKEIIDAIYEDVDSGFNLASAWFSKGQGTAASIDKNGLGTMYDHLPLGKMMNLDEATLKEIIENEEFAHVYKEANYITHSYESVQNTARIILARSRATVPPSGVPISELEFYNQARDLGQEVKIFDALNRQDPRSPWEIFLAGGFKPNPNLPPSTILEHGIGGGGGSVVSTSIKGVDSISQYQGAFKVIAGEVPGRDGVLRTTSGEMPALLESKNWVYQGRNVKGAYIDDFTGKDLGEVVVREIPVDKVYVSELTKRQGWIADGTDVVDGVTHYRWKLDPNANVEMSEFQPLNEYRPGGTFAPPASMADEVAREGVAARETAKQVSEKARAYAAGLLGVGAALATGSASANDGTAAAKLSVQAKLSELVDGITVFSDKVTSALKLDTEKFVLASSADVLLSERYGLQVVSSTNAAVRSLALTGYGAGGVASAALGSWEVGWGIGSLISYTCNQNSNCQYVQSQTADFIFGGGLLGRWLAKETTNSLAHDPDRQAGFLKDSSVFPYKDSQGRNQFSISDVASAAYKLGYPQGDILIPVDPKSGSDLSSFTYGELIGAQVSAFVMRSQAEATGRKMIANSNSGDPEGRRKIAELYAASLAQINKINKMKKQIKDLGKKSGGEFSLGSTLADLPPGFDVRKAAAEKMVEDMINNRGPASMPVTNVQDTTTQVNQANRQELIRQVNYANSAVAAQYEMLATIDYQKRLAGAYQQGGNDGEYHLDYGTGNSDEDGGNRDYEDLLDGNYEDGSGEFVGSIVEGDEIGSGASSGGSSQSGGQTQTTGSKSKGTYSVKQTIKGPKGENLEVVIASSDPLEVGATNSSKYTDVTNFGGVTTFRDSGGGITTCSGGACQTQAPMIIFIRCGHNDNPKDCR